MPEASRPAEQPFSPFTAANAVDLLMQVFTGASLPTPEQVESRAEELLQVPLFSHLRSAKPQIVEETLRRTSVVIGAATILEDAHDHVEWLPECDRSSWRFWPRLEDYLRRVEDLPPSVLYELHSSTERTLERMENPARPGPWDRRGLVVGHVQSGKTTHYTALASKALDAGYEIVIVLAGVHNSLRSQTHERIDRHLIGRNSAALLEAVRNAGQVPADSLIGVGEQDHMLARPPLPFTLLTCTTSAEDGDFRTVVANQVGFQVGPGSRLVLVVKKHTTILRNLIDWLRLQNATGSQAGDRPIPNPALIIDDEADHASINTARDPDADPTRINQRIRELLLSFSRVGFVGYTATPFANIFVSHEDNGGPFGRDLFPRSFIINLKAPSDYVGPSLVFGHPGDEAAGIPKQMPLPMHVPVDDAANWLPDKHKRDCIPGALPGSLREALRLFVLVCAARAARRQTSVHNSMLVHATRFVDVQAKIEEQIDDELSGLRDTVGFAASDDLTALAESLRKIWMDRIVGSHDAFATRLGSRCSALPAWTEVWECVPDALQRIQIMRVNGQSTDALRYSRAKDGLSVVAIGGDKLSRGLTLEGLSVSYFLRASKMFDTLMQMGRWFGYRPGYADLCRVYTTNVLFSAFREIALAMEELRADLDYMAAVGKTPAEFGLRVREPSDDLVITAANKIRHGENVAVRFAGTLVQTLEVARENQDGRPNLDALRCLLNKLGDPQLSVRRRKVPHAVWHDIEAGDILEFLSKYEAFSTPSFFNHCEALRRYISERHEQGELKEWTVCLMGKDAPERLWRHESREFAQIRRADTGDRKRFVTQALVGSEDETLDLSDDEFARALSASSATLKSGASRTVPEREKARDSRPSGRGLLLLYLVENGFGDDPVLCVAISFPTSPTAQALSYRVNKVWLEQRGLLGDEDDDGAAE